MPSIGESVKSERTMKRMRQRAAAARAEAPPMLREETTVEADLTPAPSGWRRPPEVRGTARDTEPSAWAMMETAVSETEVRRGETVTMIEEPGVRAVIPGASVS
jgi:hypothetical protein